MRRWTASCLIDAGRMSVRVVYMHATNASANERKTWNVCIMYVCMHACMYVCMYSCMYSCTHKSKHERTGMYAFMDVLVYVFMYAQDEQVLTNWWVCMYECMYVCMYLCCFVLTFQCRADMDTPPFLVSSV